MVLTFVNQLIFAMHQSQNVNNVNIHVLLYIYIHVTSGVFKKIESIKPNRLQSLFHPSNRPKHIVNVAEFQN
jgi:hypothetical protein